MFFHLQIFARKKKQFPIYSSYFFILEFTKRKKEKKNPMRKISFGTCSERKILLRRMHHSKEFMHGLWAINCFIFDNGVHVWETAAVFFSSQQVKSPNYFNTACCLV